MKSSLNRPLAVVTGASSGIGYEAKQFAQNSFDLLVPSTLMSQFQPTSNYICAKLP